MAATCFRLPSRRMCGFVRGFKEWIKIWFYQESSVTPIFPTLHSPSPTFSMNVNDIDPNSLTLWEVSPAVAPIPPSHRSNRACRPQSRSHLTAHSWCSSLTQKKDLRARTRSNYDSMLVPQWAFSVALAPVQQRNLRAGRLVRTQASHPRAGRMLDCNRESISLRSAFLVEMRIPMACRT